MENDKTGMYFCPPKLTTQYRLFIWNVYDLFIGLFVCALGLLWFGNILFAAGLLFLVMKAYVTEEKSIYMMLKSVFLYIVTPQSYSQYID